MKYQELISKLSLDEKASLMSGKDFWQTMNIDDAGIPSIFLADGPHGIRKQAAAADHLGLNQSLKATCFPTSATTANSFNDVLGEEIGTALGKEAVSQKVNVLLGPGLNIKRSPLCGRNFEYYSEDPYLAGKMAASYVRGIQKAGISACLKHFAANNQEVRRMIIDTVIDERTYREIYLTNFEIAVKEGKAKTVMSAYNKINGEYANESMHLLKEILRDDWGYKGVVVTDWGGNNDRVEALKCGNELEMPTNGGETNREIVEAVKSGKLDEKYLDEAVDRLLTLIFDTEKAFAGERKKIDADAHHELARKAAEESIVLLKNENSTLPLKEKTKTAVIGDFAYKPRYQGAGSSIVNPFKIDSTLDCVKESGLEFIGYQPGFKRYGKKDGGYINRAVKLAQSADVVLLYLGLDEATETEGLDRTNMKLPQNQIDLINALKKTGKKIVAVLSCGSAIELGFTDSLDAVVHGYLGGQAGAKAILNVIMGKVNPSGKLAESYPHRYEDSPTAPYFPSKPASIEYREGLYVGYRYFNKVNMDVKFPFGFGLSYTTFAYSDLTVTDEGATFKIKNTGAVAGKEAAQLYIGAKDGKVFRPVKELKGFKKVYLEAGEEKEVFIPFEEYAFRYFNPKTNKWEIEGCTYNIMIGASSSDIKLTAEYAHAGTGAENPYNEKLLPSYYSGNIENVSKEEFEALIGRAVPPTGYNFVKKKRIIVDYNSAVSDLRYSKGWSGRFFAGVLRFAYNLLRFIGKRDLANVMMLGMFHMPLRGLSRMTGGMITHAQLDGLITMFNGKFFKGLGQFFGAGKAKKQRIQAEKAAKEQKAK